MTTIIFWLTAVGIGLITYLVILLTKYETNANDKANKEFERNQARKIVESKREWEKQFGQKRQAEIQEAIIISEEKVHKPTPAQKTTPSPKSTPVQKTEPPPKPRSAYTQEAIIFGQNNKILLIDGNSFIASIKELTPPPQQQQQLLTFATAGDYTTPTCARCDTKMIKRTAKESGSEFWGCANFPRCRHKQKMRRAA
jgi:ssDNA-binding Zn-finger/Zn-ribbon topoisomerase 1